MKTKYTYLVVPLGYMIGYDRKMYAVNTYDPSVQAWRVGVPMSWSEAHAAKREEEKS